jgi:hypothetical protein
MSHEALQRVADENPQDPHENVLRFHREKVEEVDGLLAGNCRCRVVPHTWTDIHLSADVCAWAAGPEGEAVRCMDSMTYLLEDLHDTTWLMHTCFERRLS